MSHPVLITGGAQRIGLAIARDLLAQQIPVIVTYRTVRPAVEQLKKDGATLIHADFSTREGIDRAIVDCKIASHSLRAIIHNASDWEAEGSSDPADLMHKMWQVHTLAPYLINLGLEEALKNAGMVTDIIHFTDNVQQTGSDKHIAYAASKAALHNLTLSFAKKLAPTVKVNTIAPALLEFNQHDTQEYRNKALSKSILGVVPGAQEAVKAVNYLLSSDYMTGQCLYLNGGRHLK